jgi:hypothetical protein
MLYTLVRRSRARRLSSTTVYGPCPGTAPGVFRCLPTKARPIHCFYVSCEPMAFHITHADGRMESAPPLSALPRLLDELAFSDAEHGDVSLTHESEWCISVSHSGFVAFENLGEGEPRHMRSPPRKAILDLWARLSRGEIESIESEAWLPGYR